ncbi:hypothetical protein [Kitasatospora griseola]|uniref:hypothetical protein n=1 Tax=Kitasatospora griseola TaxID=2064 RepID=UPI0016707D65|nr:hypothetical protein [Kitasatospora griseola]
MGGERTMRGHRPRTAVLAAVALLLTGCAGVAQYYEGTGLHDATAAEAVGSWEGDQQAHLTLHQDGTATVERLDGQDWAYEDGWRLSGTGRWELTDEVAGQRLVLDLTTRTALDTRPDARRSLSHTEPPTAYRWRFHLKRDRQHRLELFVFIGDPDGAGHHLLTRTPAEPPAAPLPTAQ